ALRAGDEGAKVSIIKATQEAIDGARERGYLSDQESVQWRQRATEDYALSSIEMLDPAKQIEALDTSKFASLIPSDKRAALRAVAENKIRIQQDRAQAQADRREAKAERALFQYQQQIASGIPSTTDSVNRWAAAVQGTAMEGEFVALSKGEQEVQSLMREPLDAQIRFVEEKRASLQKSGGTLAEAANIDRLERAVNSNVKMLREQPLAFYAVRSGESPAPIDLGGLQTEDGLSQLAGQLGERFDAVTSLRKQYGSEVARNPWRPEEIPMVKAFIAQADDDTKLNLFGSIAAASPTAADYSAALKEISADQPITMLAGMAHARGLKGADGTEVPRVLLAGSKVLADKSTPMPSEKELRLAFDEQVGSSIASGTPQREQAYIAFKSIYAGLSGSRGIRHEDSFTNDELVDEAVLLSTGGIGERAGAKVVKPYGMGDKDFDKAVDAQLEALTKKSGFLFRELEDMPLTPVPGKEGAYYLMNAGRIQLDPKTSEPMTVTVK
ncbi:MAG TPA: hypothetical protein VLG17_00050, partial [Pseudomonas sp.]|uniref:hypothetical protein n=1 Tax=Pseudomonas sp. TaxID=306 RepID=UPI002BBCD4F4